MTLIPGLTGQNILDRFTTMTDDTIDSIQGLFLMNAGKDLVEAGRDWYFNRAFDNSQTWSPGDTYLTTKPLPANFLAPREIYLDGDILPYVEVPFELRERYKDTYRRFYIDYLNRTFGICGSGPGVRKINMYYGAASDAITLTTAATWPTQFHPLLVFKMAEVWGSTSEADDINYRQSKEQLRQANDFLKMMIAWDGRLKTRDYNSKNNRNTDITGQPNVVGSEFLFQ